MKINEVWPEWCEDSVLGEGSFGKVYKAKRVEYGRTFYSAIKVISVPKNEQEIRNARTQGMNDSEIYDYFRSIVDNLLNEITLMDNLKGAKNIVGIEDYKIIEKNGELGWEIFIRMELLTSFDVFIANPEFSQKDVIRLGVDICTALENCEQNCILHRDIKPDNIFFSERFGEYKLGDFGIARKLEATQANLSRKGTLNYMAPEVYKSEEYGSTVDIYSLGLVLYTLLNNNRVPFFPPYPQPITYKDNEEALTRRLSGEPLMLPCNAGVSLGNAIVKACAYNAADRYQTATEFKNALVAEWNVLVASGDDREIASDPMRFGGGIDQRLKNTTNDMTAHGHIVVDEYRQGTTVLDQGTTVLDGAYVPYQNDRYVYDNGTAADVVADCSLSRSNKGCRILAYPCAVAVIITGIILLILKIDGMTLASGIAMMGLGVCTLMASGSRISIGLCLTALSVPHIAYGLHGLLDGIVYGIPTESILLTVTGMMILFGGVTVLIQREVRLGGALSVSAVAIVWLYNAYVAANGDFVLAAIDVCLVPVCVCVFLWSYGYKSDAVRSLPERILGIISCVLGAMTLLCCVGFCIGVFFPTV